MFVPISSACCCPDSLVVISRNPSAAACLIISILLFILIIVGIYLWLESRDNNSSSSSSSNNLSQLIAGITLVCVAGFLASVLFIFFYANDDSRDSVFSDCCAACSDDCELCCRTNSRKCRRCKHQCCYSDQENDGSNPYDEENRTSDEKRKDAALEYRREKRRAKIYKTMRQVYAEAKCCPNCCT